MASISFTERIVAELAPQLPPLQCCRGALIEGMRRSAAGGEIITARRAAARAAMASLHDDGIAAHVEERATPRRRHFAVAAGGAVASSSRLCCRRSRLRGSVLAAGSVSRGDAAPHVEIPAADARAQLSLLDDCAALGIAATAVTRRGARLIVVRSAAGVAVLLSSIGAQGGRLEFEEGRVVREVRGGVNRRLNAETGNLRRTVTAAIGQLDAIATLREDRRRWDGLPPALREAAELRLRLPSESLETIATAAGCSRSAMADRLRRLMVAADAA